MKETCSKVKDNYSLYIDVCVSTQVPVALFLWVLLNLESALQTGLRAWLNLRWQVKPLLHEAFSVGSYCVITTFQTPWATQQQIDTSMAGEDTFHGEKLQSQLNFFSVEGDSISCLLIFTYTAVQVWYDFIMS